MIKQTISLLLLISIATSAQAQIWKKKKDNSDTTKKEVVEDRSSKKGGPNLFTKLITKVAKVAGGTMQTQTTNDLTTVVPTVYYQTNLHPGNLGTVEQSFYEGWQTSGNMLTIMFTNKNASGMTKIDGTVTVDGKPMNFATMGVYNVFSDNNTAPKKVEITSSTGQKSSFIIQPPKQGVKVVSVNGSSNSTIAIDPAKDLTLELENTGDNKGLLAVRLLVKTVGISYWSEIGYFPASAKIVIPAAHLRNANNTNGSLTNFKKSYLSVVRSSMDKATNVSGIYPDVEYSNMYLDGKYMNINPDIELSKGITIKASDKFQEGSVQYEFIKANAFSSRPIKQIKNIAVVSFAVRGILYDYKADTKYNIGDQSYTSSTKTIQFPQLPDAMWDKMLDDFYVDIKKIFEEELGAAYLPIEKVKATDAYQRMNDFSKDDANTSVAVSRGYKGLKVISAFVPLTEAWGPNNNMNKLLAQTSANAVLKVTLDLQPAWQGKNAVMVPKLAVEMSGLANGEVFPTKYFTANIIGKGVETKENITATELDRIVRRGDLMTQLRKGLQETIAKEKANGDYDIVWPVK